MKSRTFARLGVAIAMIAAFTATACDDEAPTPPPTPVLTVSPANLQVNVGGTGTIVASISNVTNPSFTYSSANTSVATVSGSGSTATVTGVAAGNTTIIVTETVSGLSQGVQVSVTGGDPNITVTVTPASATIPVNGNVSLFATVNGTTNQQVTWTSQDNSVATVNASGVVTGVSAGTAVIVATSAANANARGTATITVTAGTPPSVSIAPLNPTITINETIQFSASVTGTTNTAVTWSSSNAAVASINSSGLASGLTAGSTIITATSVANPSVVASTTLTVTQPPTANVSIASVSDPTNNVQGQTNVTVNIDAPVGSGVASVELHLVCPRGGTAQPNDTTTRVGQQSVSAGTSGQITFQVFTDELDDQGNPLFLNQNCEFQALLLGQQGSLIAQAQGFPITLNNTSFLIVTPVADTTALDPNGFQWNGGTLRVTVQPVVFESATGSSVSRVNVTVTADTAGGGTGSVTLSDTTSADGFTFVLPDTLSLAAGGVDNVEDSTTVITFNSVRAGGTQGPSVTIDPTTGAPTQTNVILRLDNVAPSTTAASFMADSASAALAPRATTTTAFWLNGPFAFSTFVRNSTIVDGGVNRNSTQVFVADSTTTGSRIPANAATASTGADVAASLGESSTATRYTAWLRVSDALGNADTLRLVSGNPAALSGTEPNATFGIDVTAPSIQFHPTLSVPANATRQAADSVFRVEFQDVIGTSGVTPSGFQTATPVQVTVIGRDTVSTNNVCLVGTYGSNDSTVVANCKPVSDDSRTELQDTSQYQVYTGFVVDRAQNQSNMVMRTAEVDKLDPTGVVINGDATPEGGESETYTVEARDNLDLETLRSTTRYPTANIGGVSEIRGSSATVGAFGCPVGCSVTNPFSVRDSTASVYDPFVVSIEETASSIPSGLPLEADAVVGYATDVAGRTTSGTLGLTIAPQPSFAAAPDNVNSFSIVSSAGASTIRATVNVTEVGNTADTPFERARLYRVTSTGLLQVGEATNPLISDLGATRDFAYEFSASGAGLAKNDVFVVLGIAPDGRALATQTQTRP